MALQVLIWGVNESERGLVCLRRCWLGLGDTQLSTDVLLSYRVGCGCFSFTQAGVRINSSKLVSTEDKFSDFADKGNQNLIAQVFKFGRSRPRIVLERNGIIKENTIICGVAVGDRSIC